MAYVENLPPRFEYFREKISCSNAKHVTITLLVTATLAALALYCHCFQVGGTLAPAFLGISSFYVLVISSILAYCKMKKPHLEESSSQSIAIPPPSALPPSPPLIFGDTERVTPPPRNRDSSSPPPVTNQSPIDLGNLWIPRPGAQKIPPDATFGHHYVVSRNYRDLLTKLKFSNLQNLASDQKFHLLLAIAKDRDMNRKDFFIQVAKEVLPTLDHDTRHGCDPDSNTLLHVAVCNNLIFANFLIDSNLIHVHLENAKGETPLYLAITKIEPDLVRKLIACIEQLKNPSSLLYPLINIAKSLPKEDARAQAIVKLVADAAWRHTPKFPLPSLQSKER